MSDVDKQAGRPTSVRQAAAELPRWKKIMLLVAGVFVLVGAGLAAAQEDEPRPADGGSSPGTPLVSNLRSGDTTSTSASEAEAGQASAWSPFFLKGGFSFFVGFTVGFAFRMFVKATLLVLGGLFLVLFLLSYADLIAIDWTTLESYYDGLSAQLGSELEHFRTFIAGSLPSAGLTGLGLFTGFKKG